MSAHKIEPNQVVVVADSVDEALQKGVTLLKVSGVSSGSRNGDVLQAKTPILTQYNNPRHRVLFNEIRDANPFFHFMESLWMIGGRDDVAWIAQFNKSIAKYSQNNEYFHGAYGLRWRNFFLDAEAVIEPPTPIDQLDEVVKKLSKDKTDRRAVVAMWDGSSDLVHADKIKDVPCNLNILFAISDCGKLNMTLLNRSNDIIWGAYGANAVHFSFLQEVMAQRIGVEVGKYFQFSNNYHAYVDVFNKHAGMETIPTPDYYETNRVSPFPIINTDWETWDGELKMFLEEGDKAMGYTDIFFRKVALPMYQAWFVYQDKNLSLRDRVAGAQKIMNGCVATDWQVACLEWLYRRLQNAK